MARQDQSVGDGTAYQALGDLTVVNGISSEQMASIMLAMGRQLHVYFSEAEAKVEERLAEFRQTVIEAFSDTENKGSPDAFRDPDFQFVLSDAQKVYVRDGEHELRDDLIRLLIQRSNIDSKERTAKILNFAIEISGSLSKNEYAALAINFLFSSVALLADSREVLLRDLNSFIAPFYTDLSDNPTVYGYLESQRCISINHTGGISLIHSLHEKYRSIISYGFDPNLLNGLCSEISIETLRGLTIPAAGYKGYIRFKKADPHAVAGELMRLGASQATADRAITIFNKSTPSVAEFQEIMCEEVEGFSQVMHVWEKSVLYKVELTAVGKAIAHSSLTSRTNFLAPLNIWVN
jgi:hypothetical protein